MKKLYILIIALLAIHSAMAQGCLPEGITFTHQIQIDSFPTKYPNCSEIIGNLVINGVSINSLENLNQITAIGGGLYIGYSYLIDLTGLNNLISVGGAFGVGYNDVLLNLNGLDSLKSIGNYLYIQDNNKLMNLNGLDSLSYLGGYVSIAGNPELTNLYGIGNIDPSTISDLQIWNNLLLSNCDAESICNYLTNSNNEIEIHDNTTGCNSREEVETACLVGLENIIQENKLSIFPNPSSSRFTIQFSLENEEQVKLLVLNNLGQVVAIVANERLSEGEHEINWNAEGMPAGVYFYNIQIGKQAGTGKLVLMK